MFKPPKKRILHYRIKVLAMNIIEAKKQLQDDPQIGVALRTIIIRSIEKKHPLFKTQETEEYQILQANSLTITHVTGSFEIQYDSFLACLVLLEIAEEILGEVIPQNIREAMAFANRFSTEIRNPKPNHIWDRNLVSDFKRFILVYLNSNHSIDITEFLFSTSEESLNEDKELRSFERHYRDAFPYLSDSFEKAFKALQFIETNGPKEYVAEILSEFGKHNLQRAAEFYTYLVANHSDDSTRYRSLLLIGLFDDNEEHYFKELQTLYAQHPSVAVMALAWIKYNKSEHIQEAHNMISIKPVDSEDFRRFQIIFWTRQVENENISPMLLNTFFEEIGKVYERVESNLKKEIEWRVSLIKGFDNEKFSLLHILVKNNNLNIIKEYFRYFSDAKFFFALIKDCYISVGPFIDFSFFQNGLQSLSDNNPESVKNEVYSLLSHELAVVRLAGIKILETRYVDTSGISLLLLNKEDQLNIMTSLQIQPAIMEGLFPFLLQFRKSDYAEVKGLLFEILKDLIWAYDKHLFESLKSKIDMTDAEDKELWDKFEMEFENFSKEKEARLSIQELNPVENEPKLMELYYQYENEYQAELMQKAQDKTTFAQFAKKIQVIRGSGYKSGHKDEISMMGTYEMSKPLDRRYYIDPDFHEWLFKATNMS